MDEIDEQVLKLLKENSRAAVREIAKKTKASRVVGIEINPSAVAYFIRNIRLILPLLSVLFIWMFLMGSLNVREPRYAKFKKNRKCTSWSTPVFIC